MASKEVKVGKSNTSQQDNDFDDKIDEKISNEGNIDNVEMPRDMPPYSDSEQEESDEDDTQSTRKEGKGYEIKTKTDRLINWTKAESMKESGASKSEDDSDVKPSHSYIALIAMAILSCANKKMILGDIYQYISDNFPYYRNKDKSWRNSIRHNLSLNECFIKAGRSENGKGNYWAIHPANLEDFSNGDFRRRRARRRVRKSNTFKFSSGLSGYPYFRGYAPLSAYSTFLPYKGDEFTSRMCTPAYSSPYGFMSGNRKNFDNIMTPTSYKHYYPGTAGHPIYDQPNIISPYPLPPLNTDTNTMDTTRCSPAPAVVTDSRTFRGPYSSSLSALASLSNSHRGNESWQDTLCKLQENLRKPSRET